ncbi:MAG: hypothetical protein SR2Q5_04175 [Quinella sp. 2Q5]|nr:hypothetical protein [Quinella sp. 2Q5]
MTKLIINENLFIGSGGHQATYVHPIDATKCIKIPHSPDDGDVRKEMRYRQICAGKLARSRLVTEFFGTVETNLGLGYVFERVIDYDGKTSRDMKKFLPTTKPDAATLQQIWTVLLTFKSDFLRENIAIVDTDIENFMVQETAPEVFRVRIVDNIGTPVLIPLVYWFDFAAAWKARRYWNRIVAWLAQSYPLLVTPEFAAQLKT